MNIQTALRNAFLDSCCLVESTARKAPHPSPLPIGWGEGGQRPGEGASLIHCPEHGFPEAVASRRNLMECGGSTPLWCGWKRHRGFSKAPSSRRTPRRAMPIPSFRGQEEPDL